MPYEIVYDPDFETWFNAQSEEFQDEMLFYFNVLSQAGPQLGRKLVDHIKGSSVPNMKELRFDFENMIVRILFAFDLRRQAYILLGGDKSNDKKWYLRNVPIADKRFLRHYAAQRAEIEAEAKMRMEQKR